MDLIWVFIVVTVLDDVQRLHEIKRLADIKEHFENITSPLHYSIEFGKLHIHRMFKSKNFTQIN